MVLAPTLQPWALIGAAPRRWGGQLSSWESYPALFGFCVLASASYLAMEIYASLRPHKSQALLAGLRSWIDAHTDQVIILGSLILGLYLIAKDIYLIVSESSREQRAPGSASSCSTRAEAASHLGPGPGRAFAPVAQAPGRRGRLAVLVVAASTPDRDGPSADGYLSPDDACDCPGGGSGVVLVDIHLRLRARARLGSTSPGDPTRVHQDQGTSANTDLPLRPPGSTQNAAVPPATPSAWALHRPSSTAPRSRTASRPPGEY